MSSDDSEGGTSSLLRYTSMDDPPDVRKRVTFVNEDELGDDQVEETTETKPVGEHVFGIQPWYELKTWNFTWRPSKPVDSAFPLTFGNVVWILTFGWILMLAYLLVGCLFFVSMVGKPYARLCWDLAFYFLWPFGKYVTRERTTDQLIPATFVTDKDENTTLIQRDNNIVVIQDEDSTFTVHSPTIEIFWKIFGAIPLSIVHGIIFAICWMTVILIPMAKVNLETIKSLFHSPLKYDLQISYTYTGRNVILCTYQAFSLAYFKYSIYGMNIVLFNLSPFVIISILVGYAVPHEYQPTSFVMFTCSLLSIIPLSYYIGTAVSSLSAQSNFAVGAVLNASFGSIVELILYCSAIMKGGFTKLVQASIVGSLLLALLLMPGLAMIFSALKSKEQRFSATVAGVSSVLLFISIVGAFTPTVFYYIYSHRSINCTQCVPHPTIEHTLNCFSCDIQQLDHVDDDNIYTKHARTLMYLCSAILPLAYVIGLVFTLKTHTHIYEEHDKEEGGGGHHDGPEWSKAKGISVLVAATVCFALVAEELLASIQPTLDTIGVSQTFVGLTLVAITTAAAEIVNAIQFAYAGNIALSIEIGSSVAVQIALIQMPVLVGFSAVFKHLAAEGAFILLFPMLETFCVILSVIIINYTATEGVANYFKGSALVIIYILFILTLAFVP